MPPPKSGQGMRQPQLGGVQSQIRLAGGYLLCKHDELWRLGPEYAWVCAVCHPPAVANVERTTREAVAA